MPANAAAENALGTLGTICWTIQMIPQIWKSWRDKSTEGLSEHLVFFWGASGAFMGVYAIVQDLNIPLILQPQLSCTLCFASWAQCQYYGRKRSKSGCLALYIACLAILAGFQAGMTYAVQPSYRRGNDAGVEFFGIASSVVIALALLPQYYEIYKRREVVGISILFMTIDMLGGVFNDLSLAFKAQFNIIASVTYSLVVVMDGSIILLALVLNPLAERRRKREALAAAPTGASDPPSEENRVENGADLELAVTSREDSLSVNAPPEACHDRQHEKDEMKNHAHETHARIEEV